MVLNKVVLCFESVHEILTKADTAYMYYVQLCKVFLSNESVDEILKCEHSNN